MTARQRAIRDLVLVCVIAFLFGTLGEMTGAVLVSVGFGSLLATDEWR